MKLLGPAARVGWRAGAQLRYSVWGLTGLLALMALARLIPYFPIPLPVCGLRALTGIPCPLCGSTRCLRAWSRLDPVEAFQFNPLVATAFIGVATWLAIKVLEACFGQDWSGFLTRWARQAPWPALLIAAALANWAYLICYLPK